MKIIRTDITVQVNSLLSVEKREESYFHSPFHFHPEFELVYIVESHGQRIIGNEVGHFAPGDMVLLGPEIPHIWLNHSSYQQPGNSRKAVAIVLYFHREIFSNTFYSLKETCKLNQLFQNACRGLQISGTTNQVIAQKLLAMTGKKDMELFLMFFDILNILVNSKDTSFITKETYAPFHSECTEDRLSCVLAYTKKHFRDDITLEAIARIANLTPPSFCRFFKKRMKKSFVEYLNEIRIDQACSLFLETEKSVSEVAYACGFKTPSNFNKIFRKIMGKSPRNYKEVAENLAG